MNDIITQLQQYRFIFTASPGRCGTNLLANLFNLIPSICAEHEPTPYIDNIWWRLRTQPQLAKTWLLQTKLPSILKRLKGSDSNVYIETSHMLCKGFFEPLIDLDIPFDLIILSRDYHKVALSMYDLNDIPERTKTGRRWYFMPSDQGCISQLPEEHSNLSDYQMCYWYVLEMSLRQALYYRNWKAAGQTVVQTTLKDILIKNKFRDLIADLGLPELDKVDWHNYKTMTYHKVNEKRARKSLMRSKGKTQFLLSNCPEQRKEVEELINYEVLMQKIR